MTVENICIAHFIKKILSGVTVSLYHEFRGNNSRKFSPSFKEKSLRYKGRSRNAVLEKNGSLLQGL
jgi:hypothetical protein